MLTRRSPPVHAHCRIVQGINLTLNGILMKASFTRSALSAAALLASLAGGCAASPSQANSGEPLDDEAITTRIETEILGGEGIWYADSIHVETVQGVVHLSGYAAAERNRQRADGIARSVAGMNRVNNDIRIRSL
jgi:hyperosmotically inducible periplasmic protein